MLKQVQHDVKIYFFSGVKKINIFLIITRLGKAFFYNCVILKPNAKKSFFKRRKKLTTAALALFAGLALIAGFTSCDTEPAHEHSWNNGEVTTEPTCVTKGTKTYTCKVCSATKTEEIAELYSTPVDAVTGEAATSSSTYIYFGVFAKTVLASTSKVTVDETTSVTMGANTYYKGSDGEYYAKVTENPYSTDYTYSDDSTVSSGSTRYFKVEPIKWKVLTTDYNSTGKALLLAENILTANVPYYEDWRTNRTINDKTVYPNNYEHSQIRAYLNGINYEGASGELSTWNDKGFLQTAFTASAQGLIATTEVKNDGESTTDAAKNLTRADGYKADGTTSSGYTDYTCANTSDKIFLLSEKEVTTTGYGFTAYNVYVGDSNGTTESSRIRVTTDYAKANYAYQSTTAGCGGLWWLRSPGYDFSDFARFVTDDGDASSFSDVTSKIFGVVPALCLSL